MLLRYYLFFAPQVLLAIVLVLLWHRRAQRQLPALVTYVIVELLGFLIVCWVAFHHPFSRITYAWVSLVANGIVAILELMIIYTLAENLVFSRFPSFSLVRFIFGGAVATLLLAAGAISGTLSNVSAMSATNIFHAIDFSTSLVKVGMLLLLFMLTRTLRISWRNWVAGIALGFGVSACINLAGAVLRNYFGNPSIVAVDILEGTGFHICVVIWLVYFLLPERSFPVVDECLEKTELELWNHELEGVARQ